MKIEELKGDDIMMAYDGNYLSRDFGYSCANFNVTRSFRSRFNNFESYKYGGKPGEENDEEMFSFYTKNPKNISCFVVFNEEDKIAGRRMFFRGSSMINNELFNYPIKKGEEIKYMYGYYGTNINKYIKSISYTILNKYGSRSILFSDRIVFDKKEPVRDIPNLWIMKVDRSDFRKFPPIDILSVSTELSALSNFDPNFSIINVLEKDFNKTNVDFHQAYRYKPGEEHKKFDYKTWAEHFGKIEEEDEEDETTKND